MLKKKVVELEVGDIIVFEGKRNAVDYGFVTKVDLDEKRIEVDCAKEVATFEIENENDIVRVIGSEFEEVDKRKFSQLLLMAKQSTKNIYLVDIDNEHKKGKNMYVCVVREDDKIYLRMKQMTEKGGKKNG